MCCGAMLAKQLATNLTHLRTVDVDTQCILPISDAKPVKNRSYFVICLGTNNGWPVIDVSHLLLREIVIVHDLKRI